MKPEKQKALEDHVKAIAKILYEETEPKDLASLAKIEATVRDQTLEHITPRIGFFLSNKVQEPKQGELDNWKVLSVNYHWAKNKLESSRSNLIVELALILKNVVERASANVSYKNAAEDVERYTGIKVSEKTQQRARSSPWFSWV